LAKARQLTAEQRRRGLAVRRDWRQRNKKRVSRQKRNWYRKNRKRILARYRCKYKENRQTILAERHRQYDANRRRVSAEELEECRQDPRKAKSIRGPDVIVCLECGEMHEMLPPHLRTEHQMNAAKYKAKPGPDGVIRRYNAGTGLVSMNVEVKLSKAAKGRRRKLPRHPEENLRSYLAKGRKYQRSQEYRLNDRDANVGKAQPSSWKKTPDGQVVTDFRILESHLAGMRAAKLARHVGLKPSSVGTRLRKIGFPSAHARLFEHGEPITGQQIVAFCKDFEKTKKEAATLLNVSYQTVLYHTSSRRVVRSLPLELANRVIFLRSTSANQSRHQAATRWGGRPRLLLPSDKEALPNKYRLLRQELKLLRQRVRQQDDKLGIDQVWDWLCEQSRKGTIRTILFWPQFHRWLEKNYGCVSSLRGSFSPSELASQFLADDYHTSVKTIKRTVLRT
jgi:hypothetical protein